MKITNEYIIYIIFLLEIIVYLIYLYVICIYFSKKILHYIKEPQKLTQKRTLLHNSTKWLISKMLQNHEEISLSLNINNLTMNYATRPF